MCNHCEKLDNSVEDSKNYKGVFTDTFSIKKSPNLVGGIKEVFLEEMFVEWSQVPKT